MRLKESCSAFRSGVGENEAVVEFILINVCSAVIMGKKRKVLSEAEIWDDSALIQSWDDALEEYKVI